MSLKWSHKLIGLILLGLIFYFLIDFSKLNNVLASIKWIFFLPALGLILLKAPLPVYRWQYILKKLSVNINFNKIFKIFYLNIFLGFITPAKTGEIAGRSIAIKQNSDSLSYSSSGIIIDRIVELIFLLLASGIGVIISFSYFKLNIFLAITLSLLFLIFLLSAPFITKIQKIFFFLLPSKKLKKNLKNSLKGLRNLKLKDYSIIFLLTVLIWCFIVNGTILIAKGLSLTQEMPIIFLITSIFLAKLMALLPISIAGLGTREATFLYLFSFFNVAPEKTIIFSISMFLLSIISLSLINIFNLLTVKINYGQKI